MRRKEKEIVIHMINPWVSSEFEVTIPISLDINDEKRMKIVINWKTLLRRW